MIATFSEEEKLYLNSMFEMYDTYEDFIQGIESVMENIEDYIKDEFSKKYLPEFLKSILPRVKQMSDEDYETLKQKPFKLSISIDEDSKLNS